MRKDLIAIVCCPVHKTALALTARKAAENGDVLEGSLHCAACRFDYPIEDGIPNLLPPEYHVDQVKDATDDPHMHEHGAAKAKRGKGKAPKA